MKKCASCAKDLPEAALHCVFCGAKQVLVPAVQPSVAKTAFGYSANEVMQQLGNQGYQPPRPGQPADPYAAPRPNRPSQPPVPTSNANAATVMMPPAPPGPGYNQTPAAYAATAPASPAAYAQTAPAPHGGGYGAPYGGGPSPGYGSPDYGQSPGYGAPGGPMGIHSPHQQTPGELPVQMQPYLGAETGAAVAGRPIDPWRDTLRLMMFIWGAVALATFATPLRLDPAAFNWDLIADVPGKGKIPPLIWAAAGLLSIICAAAPLGSVPRGIVGGALGLAGLLTPLLLGDALPWQAILLVAGLVTLIPGLLIRNEYTDSLFARVLVTIGVVCVLVPFMVPEGGEIPLVGVFKGLIEAPGKDKIEYVLQVLFIVLVVLTLLVWMPGPASAGGNLFAWALILFPLVVFAVKLLTRGGIGDVASSSPGALVTWAPQVVYSVLAGYGVAVVAGKQLE